VHICHFANAYFFIRHPKAVCGGRWIAVPPVKLVSLIMDLPFASGLLPRWHGACESFCR